MIPDLNNIRQSSISSVVFQRQPYEMRRLILKPKTIEDVAIKGIIFDMDGTLCLPQTYMFQQMRDALGISKSIDILDHVNSLEPAEEKIAQEKLQAIERDAMAKMEPQPGLKELMTFLESNDIKKTICTRNFPIPVNHLRTKFLDNVTMEPIITREFKPPKPHPAGILKIIETWDLQPESVIMVGDSIDDMTAGYRAGVATILLQSDVNTHLNETKETDLVVDRLDHIIDVLNHGFQPKEKPQN